MIDRRPEVIAFIGPSCSVLDAQRVLPTATYLPPLKCGDILQALRLKPRRIAIIDGVFREVPSTWHKEILFAMDSGVEVWGAASMGALRAAELAEYGMRGFGPIFSDYFNGVLTDDDEVALLFGQVGDQYYCVSDAMVNIRATIAEAVDQSVVPPEYADKILSELKNFHYSDRHLVTYLKRRDDERSRVLLQWVSQGHAIDLKREDAMGLLSYLQAHDARTAQRPLRTNHTLALRRLNLRIMTAPLDFELRWLPPEEQYLQSWKSRRSFALLRRLAYFLAMYDGLLAVLSVDVAANSTERPFSVGVVGGGVRIVDHELQTMITGLDALLAHHQRSVGRSGGSWRDAYCACLKLEDMYIEFKRDYGGNIDRHSRESPVEHRILYLLSQLWWFHQEHLRQLQLSPQADRVQEQTVEFRRVRRLLSGTDTHEWMSRNDLDAHAMQELMAMECNYRYLVEGSFFEHLGFLEPPHCRCWLLDAATLVEELAEGRARKA